MGVEWTLGYDVSGSDADIEIIEAKCPSGMKPVTGGFVLISGNGEVWYSARTADGWAIGGDNDVSFLTATLRAYAYCSPGVASLRGAASQADLNSLETSYRAAENAAAAR